MSTRIFLDFDGVLHPVDASGYGLFCHLARFEAVVREHPEIVIVLSTAWREMCAFDELLEPFGDDIRAKIVGITPVINGGCRYDEIIRHLNECERQGHSWIAIDDFKPWFPEDCPNLIWCHPRRGFDAEAEVRLRARLAQMSGMPYELRVWLDDEQPAPAGWVRTRHVGETVDLLWNHNVGVISLDHDLGDYGPATGYDVLAQLLQSIAEGRWQVSLPEIRIHATNPVSRERMNSALASIKRMVGSMMER